MKFLPLDRKTFETWQKEHPERNWWVQLFDGRSDVSPTGFYPLEIGSSERAIPWSYIAQATENMKEPVLLTWESKENQAYAFVNDPGDYSMDELLKYVFNALSASAQGLGLQTVVQPSKDN